MTGSIPGVMDWTTRDIANLNTGFDAFRRRQTDLALYDHLLRPVSPERQQQAETQLSQDDFGVLAGLAEEIPTLTGPANALFDRLIPLADGIDGEQALREALESDRLSQPNKDAGRAALSRYGSSEFTTDRISRVGQVLVANDESLRGDVNSLQQGVRPERTTAVDFPDDGPLLEGGIAATVGGAVLIVTAVGAVATAPVWIVGGACFLGGALIGLGGVLIYEALTG